MKFYSTNNPPSHKATEGKKIHFVDFRTALLQGLALDGGLFMPERFPKLNKKFLKDISKKEFWKIALEISKGFIKDIPERELKKMLKDAFNFEVPLKKINENLYILELWHGPTLAFKDFGARFMARLMNYYLRREKEKLNIIVATSGDTGSAVAQGFYGLSNIKVFVLYPSKRITALQEKQMATLGKNIVSLEVKGNFDDCQKLAKQILADKDLKEKINLSSANSINFGRLLPQSFYYFYGYAQLLNKLKVKSEKLKVIYCVPSGNFGNLTAGLMAKQMGLPVKQFIAATNANDIVPQYLRTGKFVSRVSCKTISNAMDVGNPSNFARMLEMFHGDVKQMRREIIGFGVSDKQTRETIKNVYRKTGYILDPHTAVGIAAARKSNILQPIIVLSTAHPAKFREAVEPVISKKISLPPQLKKIINKAKKATLVENNVETVKRIILEKYGHIKKTA
ncbi:MAG: threonine synthase [Candidatus Harrisonbacteria bacterium]|nr:threonine synthase [Candidatus Harrisonbacteria bacterium]